MKMEKIIIDNLRVWAFHGVAAQEREVGNEFKITVTLMCDLSAAMRSDNVADTINYADVIAVIKQEMSLPSALLENVVYRIKQSIIQKFSSVVGGSIRLDKLTPPIACEVAAVGVETSW